ncbi:MAG: hypothetical protein R3B90_02245 [Planctomycetaceae bacterium]
MAELLGGVGQAAQALAFPIQGDYVEAIQLPSTKEVDQYIEWDDTLLSAWDLRLLQLDDAGGVAAAETEQAAAQTTDAMNAAASGWVSDRATSSRRILNVQPAEVSRTLTAQFAQAFPADESGFTPKELEQKRQTLRESLRSVNAATGTGSGPASSRASVDH